MNTLDIVADDHVRGRSEAPTTVLIYGDYECPHTRALELVLARLRHREPHAFQTVFRHFPLRELHPHAQMTAEAAEAVYATAGADAFWVMHDGLFAHQDQLDESGLARCAADAGVSADTLRAALDTHQPAGRVQRDVDSGLTIGVAGTPWVFVNGSRYRGPRDIVSLSHAVSSAPSDEPRAPR